ncbi:hypothetical protein LIER_39415 [Lithospermum erythrorhizon]|uniref:B box-type domain-containing protein n=1 Tax=Lithospermum erythrorhizon TaxID=34254 RepID=A0AAV3QFZ5_LITER
MSKRRICELCNDVAVAYCASDLAFLCLSCDSKVHGANFLVARHARKILCSSCEDFTGDQISGLGFQAKALICSSCSPELDSGELDSLSSSSSSSSFFATTRKRNGGSGKKSTPAVVVNGGQRGRLGVDSKTEGNLVIWCRRLGLNDDLVAAVVRMACDGLGICGGKLTFLPFRVCLVASLWFGMKFSRVGSSSAWQGLARLERITGLPAKLISAAESKIERLYRSSKQGQNRSLHDQQEGWAESS